VTNLLMKIMKAWHPAYAHHSTSDACHVPLLAAFFLQLDGDEPVDDDYDSLAPSSGIDPFSVPSFAPVMRVVDPVTPPSQQPAGMKQLTIQLAGAAGLGL
jgi:hypothetical protein